MYPSRRRSSGANASGSVPPTWALPPVGASRPSSVSMSVVLPAPFGPATPTDYAVSSAT
jgi:hypothetical protein